MAEQYGTVARALCKDSRIAYSKWLSSACDQAIRNIWMHKNMKADILWCEAEHLHAFVEFECKLLRLECGSFILPKPNGVERLRWGYMQGLHAPSGSIPRRLCFNKRR